MSALGQKATSARPEPMSALPPIANRKAGIAFVSLVPKDDIDLPYSITLSARRVGGMSMLIAFADRRPNVSMILLF